MQPTRPEGERSPCVGRSARWRLGRAQAKPSCRSGEPAPDAADAPSLESSPRRPHDIGLSSAPPTPPSGHINHCRLLRRSEPSPFQRQVDQDERMPRQPSQDVRVRRTRRNPCDFGSGLGGDSCSRSRSQPSGNVAASAMDTGEAPTASSEQRPGRCESVPPTGTPQSDASNASAVSKARAIASLQRLFFEEMAKGGHDANTAAVAALRRLSDAGPADMLASAGMHQAPPTSPTSAFSSPLVPRRPADVLGAEYRRRPAPMVRVPY